MREKCLEFENVCGKGRKYKLYDINFSLEPGFVYAIIGDNGAGKSTLIKSILTEKKTYTGRICFEGVDISDRHSQLMNKVGFVSEDNMFITELSAFRNGQIFRVFYDDFDMEHYWEMLEFMGINEDTQYGKMSRGEKIKMQLAFAIAHNPSLLLLDEATSGLDPVFRMDLFQVLRRLLADKNVTVLMTSHNMSEIEKNADYVAIMKEGRLGEFHENFQDRL